MDADKQVGNLIPGKVPGVEDTKNNFEQSAKASTITKEPWSVQVERADNQEDPEAAEVQGVFGAEANNVDPELFATGPVQEEPSHMEDGNANWNLGGVGLPSGLLRNNDRNPQRVFFGHSAFCGEWGLHPLHLYQTKKHPISLHKGYSFHFQLPQKCEKITSFYQNQAECHLTS